MSRPRKTLKFESLLGPLSVDELKILKAEIAVKIRQKEREESLKKAELSSRKLRDKIKIHQKISFTHSTPGGQLIKAEVIGIFADKVQVEVGGRKRSVALSRIVAVE